MAEAVWGCGEDEEIWRKKHMVQEAPEVRTKNSWRDDRAPSTQVEFLGRAGDAGGGMASVEELRMIGDGVSEAVKDRWSPGSSLSLG
jgi:hypothetical protein